MEASDRAQEPVRVLWTGGWDSTFRVCQLLLVHHATVQPYYVIEPDRRSALNEIAAMSTVRRALQERVEGVESRLKETVFVCKSDLPDTDEVERHWARLRREGPIGPQYEWLARFRRGRGLEDLELAVHRDDRAHPFLEPIVEEVGTPRGPTYRVPANSRAEGAQLFEGFSFPLLEWTKSDMEARARALGIDDIMHETWFCFIPLRGRPCGMCDPCRFAMMEGMEHRLHRAARVRHRLRFLLFTGPRAVVRSVRRGRALAPGLR